MKLHGVIRQLDDKSEDFVGTGSLPWTEEGLHCRPCPLPDAPDAALNEGGQVFLIIGVIRIGHAACAPGCALG